MDDGRSDLEKEGGRAIVFDDDAGAGPGRGRAMGRVRSRSRPSSSRSRSRAAGLPAPSPFSGVQIEYRSLSMHVAESTRVNNLADDKDLVKDKDDHDAYFAGLSYHKLSTHDICQQLNVSRTAGLSDEAAARRLARDGRNTLPRAKSNYAAKLLTYLFGGFCSVLWLGVIIFFLCWKPLSNPPSVTNLALALLVLVVIFLQAGFAAFQDWSTRRTMRAIVDLLPAEALVVREGSKVEVQAATLVAGDVVLLRMGDKVPADLRLLSHSGDLRFDRSVLTGEPDEVEASVDATDANILESRNMALMGTLVVNGSGEAVVVLTGGRSVMGRIAKATAAAGQGSTLIQREVWRFVRIIVALTVVLALVILLAWLLWLRRDHPGFMDVVAMLNNVMGCVVAFIPEGMPVAVALTLMRVARRMKAVDVLPKGLSTVETLGCVNVVCSDKTGTLTENQMVVRSVACVDRAVGHEHGDDEKDHHARLRRAALLCNDAVFDPASLHLPIATRKVQGNATDAAVLRFAAGSEQEKQAPSPRLFQIPFNSSNKWMLTLHQDEDDDTRYRVLIKGAPDVLFPACERYWSPRSGGVRPLTDGDRLALSRYQDDLAGKAERVIVLCEKTMLPVHALGTNDFAAEVTDAAVSDLTVIGILGIVDPPRPETKDTVAACRRAGARFFMVTGDYGLTAAAIARLTGIFTGEAAPDSAETIRAVVEAGPNPDHQGIKDGSLLLDGPSLSTLSSPAHWDAICAYREVVFSRTSPEQKLRIVTELRRRDNVVAVTGDGVNDAPALRAADVGVAVVSGSDVAIEAAHLVLLDRFDSIVDAIRLGRLVFQNLQKVIAYLLPAGSCSEIWPVLLNVFFGVPLPLSAFLMIIICIFTDLFMSLSLIMEQQEFDLLSLPPRNHRRDHLINAKIYVQAYLFVGLMETCTAHAMFFLYYWRHARIPIRDLFFLYERYNDGFHGYSAAELARFNATGQSVYFVTLVILQWGNILAVRNRRLSILQADPFTSSRRNPWLLLSILISFVIAIFVTEVPGIQSLFNTASVPIEHWLIPLPLALGLLCMDELRKLLVRLFPKGPVAAIAW
ncbi:ATPase, P-type, transmembrane domain protein [Ophiocordyceps camponoti-floridani]|uniref:ATPase, P-type, transmembrane domain protein n=1 Tax=Ophiocordyceps camponoti-floridani TaxID=2030778 RepID=A0A8H4Q3L7_9HYPO|nr:ATPase, P-type, transmembrane domain protein [Ophiocordyceps camponoti-floridani]